MQAKKYTLFRASNEAVRQLEIASDFFGGAAVALENLRWQIRGFRDAYPDLGQDDVVARFASGSPLGGGTNAVTLVANRTREDEHEILTGLRLISAVSIFEAWCDSIVDETGAAEELSKKLQFPNSIRGALGRIAGPKEPLLAAVQAGYLKRQYHLPDAIPELMACFRAFKEARNCLAHGGGVATPVARKAWERYEATDTSWVQKKVMRQRPELPEVVVGSPVNLTWRGVIGFTGALQRLIVTCDGEMSGGSAALNAAVARWQDSTYPEVFLQKAHPGAKGKFGYRWTLLGLPKLGKSSQAMLDEFERRGTVRLNG